MATSDKISALPKRIMIIGQPGSGKSTLAAKLGEITGLPVVHIDKDVHWLPGWVERDRQSKLEKCTEIHARDKWIFEGGFSSTWDKRLARADMLIWIDLPVWLRYWRVLKRIIKYHGKTRPDSAENCPERFSWEFIVWIWSTRKRFWSLSYDLFYSAPADKACYRLQSASDVAAFEMKMQQMAENS